MRIYYNLLIFIVCNHASLIFCRFNYFQNGNNCRWWQAIRDIVLFSRDIIGQTAAEIVSSKRSNPLLANFCWNWSFRFPLMQSYCLQSWHWPQASVHSLLGKLKTLILNFSGATYLTIAPFRTNFTTFAVFTTLFGGISHKYLLYLKWKSRVSWGNILFLLRYTLPMDFSFKKQFWQRFFSNMQ